MRGRLPCAEAPDALNIRAGAILPGLSAPSQHLAALCGHKLEATVFH